MSQPTNPIQRIGNNSSKTVPQCDVKTRTKAIRFPGAHTLTLLFLLPVLNCPAQACVSPPTGLVGWWPGEGNANDSTGGNPGVLGGGIAFAGGEVGQTFSFNGSNAYVSFAASSNLNVGAGSGLTIECWLNPENTATSQIIAEWNNGLGGIGTFLSHSISDYGGLGSLFADFRDTMGNDHYFASSPGILAAGVFQHITLTYDKASGVGKLFLNGSQVASEVLGSFTPQTSYPLYLGERASGIGTGQYFKGQIDEASIYSRALATNEIQAIYNAGSAGKCQFFPSTNCAPTSSGLVNWWASEGSSGDNIGNLNGVLYGGTTFAAGKVGQAFSFDGVNDCVTNSMSGLTNILDSYTTEFWAWPTAGRASTPENTSGLDGNGNQRYAIFPHSGPTGGTVGSGISVGTNGVSVFEHGFGYLPALLVFNTPVVGWTHIAVVYSNRRPSLYINGALVRSGLTSLNTSCPSTWLGERGAASVNQGFYAGLLDEVSIYSRALTTNEIQAIYIAGAAGKCAAPLALYIVSQPTNQTVVVGADVTFNVTAGGTGSLSYQWSFNGTAINGATASSLTKTNVQLGDAGNYTVLVSNNVTTVTSSNAVLTVNASATITLLNVNFAANQVKTGFAATGLTGSDFWNDLWFPFQPSAGLGGLKRSDGTATGVGLTVQNGAGHTGFSHPDLMYQSCCYAQDFGVITLTVTNLPVGEYEFYFYGHAGANTANTVFQLLVGGNDFGNKFTATNSSWSSTNWVEGAQYVVYRGVAVTNGGAPLIVKCHPGVSGYTYLNGLQIRATVLSPPSIVSHPTNQSVLVGADAAFSVDAVGVAPLGYQWQFFGTNLPSAIASVLTLTNVQLAQAGPYAVVVSNSGGSVTSSNAVLTVSSQPPCVSSPSGLIAWWAGEFSAQDHTGSNHGSLQNGTTFSAGMVGTAFSFDGVDDYVSVPASASLDVGAGSGFTLEFWMRPDNTSSQQVIAEWNNGSGGVGVHLWHSIGALGGLGSLFANVVDNSGGDHYFATAAGVLVASNLYHVAFTYDKASGLARIFLNGVVSSSANLASFTPRTSYPLYLGTRFSGQGVGANYQGLLDEASLYDRALTTNEIQAIYTAGSAGKCTTPVPPSIFAQPTNQTVFAGTTTTFRVVAGGTPPLSYQWNFNGSPILNATNSSVTLTNASTDQAGVYSVQITNLYASVVSSNATLTVLVLPPAILAQPTNLTTTVGSTAVFTVGASGTPPLRYQWSFNDSPLPTATNASLVLTNVGTNQVGVYAVTVTNLYGLETSSNAILALVFLTTNLFDDFDPGIDLPQWTSFGGTVQATNHGGFVSPSNALWFGGTGSRFAATRSINTTNSWDLRFYLRFGSGSPPFWDRPELPNDGVVLEYSTNTGVSWTEFARYNASTFTGWTFVTTVIPENAKIPSARFRWRQLANSGSISDHWALDDLMLTEVATPPQIVTQPITQSANAGGTFVFVANAVGSSPLHYQWRVDGMAIPGATNSSLALSNVQPSQAGDYSVQIANVAGAVISSNAELKVVVLSAFGNGQPLTNSAHYFVGSVSVELTNHFSGGLIFYTLDGSTPSFLSSQYSGPFLVSQSLLLRAIGYRADFLESGELDQVSILIVPGFSIIASSAGGGSITFNPPGGSYPSNTVVSLTAVPDAGWTFVKWLGDADGSSASTNLIVTRNKTAQAVFGTTLQTTAAGGGSVLLNPPGGVYPFGSVVQLSAVPTSGNQFGIWGNAASGNVNPLLFMITNVNPTVSALFGPVGGGQSALTVVAVGRGQIAVTPRANSYATGSDVVITATPEAGQSFLGWDGDASGTANPLALKVDTNKLVYANFSKQPRLALSGDADLIHREGVRLLLSSDPGDSIEIDWSTNLSAWNQLIALTNSFGIEQVADSAATNSFLRFYRALLTE